MTDNLLSDIEFEKLRQIAHAKWGLDINPGKVELVTGRMRKFLREGWASSVAEVLERLERGGDEHFELGVFDVLSTNLTSFYREKEHFDCLVSELLEPAAAGRPGRLRFWSAACSKGCEPYTLSMVLHDHLPDLARWDVKILASDLARSVVAEARRGVYKKNMVEDLPADIIQRHFQKGSGKAEGFYRVRREVSSLVTFALVNLTGPWKHQGPFDAIFCRNVMIYFDEPTRMSLIARMRGLLRPGGLLVLGSSEGLSETPSNLQRVQPAVYRAA
jgi:chemotaxis protein methyltransferase CheR